MLIQHQQVYNNLLSLVKMKLTQSAWETWFVASIILCLALLFIGTLDNSREIVELPYIMIIAFFNVIVCVYVGQEPSTDDDEV